MENFLGEIRIFAGNYAPEDWAFCNGQQLPISQNNALYSLLGTTYGGNGTSTFAVPNLQNRVVLGQGQGTNLSAYAMGSNGGATTVTLTQSQMPAHSHPMSVSTMPAQSPDPKNNVPATVPDTFKFYTPDNATGVTEVDMDTNMLTYAGGNQPHGNTMPTLGLSYIIAMMGQYPTQS